MSLSEDVEYCSQTDGRELKPYEILRKVSEALYYGAVIAELTFKILGKVLFLVMPSGVSFKIFDGSNVVDFRMPEKKFWALRIHIGNVKLIDLPLPKDFKHWWEVLVNPINPSISGSNNWYYADPVTGVPAIGTSYVPEKTYKLLTDGLEDLSNAVLVVGIIWIVAKLGISKFTSAVVSKMSGFYWDYKLRSMVEDTNDRTIELLNAVSSLQASDLDNIDKLEEIYSTVGYNRTRIDAIESKIGLRLMMH